MAELNLPKNVFAVKVNTQAIFDSILSERGSKRQGTRKTKNQSEVSGTGKKPWAQKGTGRARAGSLRNTIFVGGATYGGNHFNNWNLKVNKKVKKLAFNSALTLKANEKAIVIHEFKLKKPSTKDLLKQITDLKLKDTFKKVLIVTENEFVFKSANNLQKIFTTKLSSLTVEGIINADVVIFTKNDIKKLEGKDK